MGKLPPLLQLGGVFGDFPAAAPAVASTYPVGWRRPVATRRGSGPAHRAFRPRLGPGRAGSGMARSRRPEPGCAPGFRIPGHTSRIDLK